MASGWSGKVCGQAWKRQDVFLEEVPWVERTGSAVPQEQQFWQHQALAVLPSQQHSPMLYGKGFVFFPGFQPVPAAQAA